MALASAALALVAFVPRAAVYPLALLGTSLLGLANGVSAGPLNASPQVLFPSCSESAIVALHTVVGVGLGGHGCRRPSTPPSWPASVWAP